MILTPTEVASYLGIDASSEGLSDAIEQAEKLTAGRLRIYTLEFQEYVDEERVMMYTSQQVVPKHGPAQVLSSLTYKGDDKTSDVFITPNGWAFRWDDPGAREFDRITSFERMSKVKYTYSAGWTDSNGSYPLPDMLKEYIKSLTGLVYENLLASGVYDVKLGDMTIKIDRASMEKNQERYDSLVRMYARPF